MNTPIRQTRAEIDLAALRNNLAVARRLAPRADIMGVVKANAYGHGAIAIARALQNEGVKQFGVALIEEALELREHGITEPILVLGATSYEGAYDVLLEQRLSALVFRPEQVEGLAAAGKRHGTMASVHVKLDTGMGRLGVQAADVPEFVKMLARNPDVKVEGLSSHFANADLADAELTKEQVRRFRAALSVFREHGIDPEWRHLSNSAGVMALPEVRDGLELNVVRPGLMLYGMAPAAWLKERGELKPVMRWRTAIHHLKQVPAGTPISYGSTWVAQRPSLIATLPVGYADGYSRQNSSKAEVLVRGKRAKIAGRVCMDMCMVDVTDVPGVQLGDEAVLMGDQGGDRITAEELAGWANTISYEIICAIGARVPRVVVAK